MSLTPILTFLVTLRAFGCSDGQSLSCLGQLWVLFGFVFESFGMRTGVLVTNSTVFGVNLVNHKVEQNSIRIMAHPAHYVTLLLVFRCAQYTYFAQVSP